MINTSDEKSRNKAARDTEARTKRRADQAQVVTGLQKVLEADEQLLGFTRGLIAGGLRGKLTVGFEALFAPYVNIGLTERRVVLQHVQPENGKPNEILPHSFPLAELHSVTFSDIETFGGEPAGRLHLRLFSDQHFRLRLLGAEYVESAKTIAGLFNSLTSVRPKGRTSPTQSVCPNCDQVLDRISPFCPYCGQPLSMASSTGSQEQESGASAAPTVEDGADHVSRPPERDTVTEDFKVPEWRLEESPPVSVETVEQQETPEQGTEGHEMPTHGGESQSTEREGDRL